MSLISFIGGKKSEIHLAPNIKELNFSFVCELKYCCLTKNLLFSSIKVFIIFFSINILIYNLMIKSIKSKVHFKKNCRLGGT